MKSQLPLADHLLASNRSKSTTKSHATFNLPAEISDRRQRQAPDFGGRQTSEASRLSQKYGAGKKKFTQNGSDTCLPQEINTSRSGPNSSAWCACGLRRGHGPWRCPPVRAGVRASIVPLGSVSGKLAACDGGRSRGGCRQGVLLAPTLQLLPASLSSAFLRPSPGSSCPPPPRA